MLTDHVSMTLTPGFHPLLWHVRNACSTSFKCCVGIADR
jgi:hypothetical protein